MPYEVIMPRLVDCVARIASGISKKAPSEECPSLPKIAVEAVELVASRLAPQSAPALYCALCYKGPYTRKGYYLHLKRVHGSEIKEEISREIKRLEQVYRGHLE